MKIGEFTYCKVKDWIAKVELDFDLERQMKWIQD